jgi:hypothetical protein
MDAQQLIDLGIKALLGAGGLLAVFITGWAAHHWRTRDQRAEFEDLKRKRRLTNAKKAEDADLMSKHADVFVKLKDAGVTPEEFRAYYDDLTGKRRRKAAEAPRFADGAGAASLTFKVAGAGDSIIADAESSDRPPITATVDAVSGDATVVATGTVGSSIAYQAWEGNKLQVWTDPKTGEDHVDFAPRTSNEIGDAEAELLDKVWYNRHKALREKVEAGEEKVDPEVWAGALKSAERVERERDLSDWPWDDFEWGMINGKLSALRWVRGEAWDALYT